MLSKGVARIDSRSKMNDHDAKSLASFDLARAETRFLILDGTNRVVVYLVANTSGRSLNGRDCSYAKARLNNVGSDQ